MAEVLSEASVQEMTAEIASAYVGNHVVSTADLAQLIGLIGSTLMTLGVEEPVREPPKPAVPIRRSIQDDYVVCLEDGKKLKLLKRHLAVHYNMTPQQYRERWGLPDSYPMVAPNYAKARSELAQKTGLGKRATPTKARRRSKKPAS